MDLPTQIEQDIMHAAEKVFYIKGKEGASMQEIADEANITRTSLNYYYRSKDKLFESVFHNTMSHFVPRIATIVTETESFEAYIPRLVEAIIDTMIENPHIPVFVLQELSSNPNRMPQVMQELGLNPEAIIRKMRDDEFLGKLPVDPRQLIINVFSMCIFPFASKPILISILFDGDENAYIEAMKQRKILIPKMLNQMIKNFTL